MNQPSYLLSNVCRVCACTGISYKERYLSAKNLAWVFRQLSITLLLLTTIFSAYAQVSGHVQDHSHHAIPFANVLVLSSDSSLVKGVVTDDKGNFSFSLIPSGKYLLAISMIGYQTYYAPLPIQSDQLVDLGIFNLQEQAKELGEVVVQGQKILYEQHAGKLVIHVKNSITSSGSTVLDILEKSPGVAVNRQSGAIALYGKEGVGVLINGKFNRMPVSALLDMLRGMNGSTIEKIELMANPSASYDAEGTGGMINIVMQKNTVYGTNGNASITAGYGFGEKNGLGLSVNSRQEKLNLYGEYSFFRDRTQQLYDIYRSLQLLGHEAFTSTHSDRQAVITNHTARLGLDYTLGARTILSGLLSGYTNKWQMDAFHQTFINNPSENSYIQTDNTETNHWQHLMGNISLFHTFSKGQKLRLDIDHLVYHDSNPSDYMNHYINEKGEILYSQQAYIRKTTPIRIKVAKLDYQQILSNKVSFEAGIKGTSSRFRNTVKYAYQQGEEWVTDPEISQKYQLREDIAAVYTTWQLQIQANTKLVAGVRYEYTDTDLSAQQKSIINRKYSNLFPNAVLSHQLDKEQSVQISYGRRINRPTFNDLAPFVIFYGPNNYESGNPALQPSLAHALSMQYQRKEWIASLQYNYENKPIAGYQPHINLTTNELFNYAENLKKAKTLSFSLLVPFQITSWWNMQNTLLAMRYQVRADYQEVPEKLTNHNIRINSTQRFSLPLGFSAEVSAYYQSPSLFGLYEQRAMGSVNMGLQKKVGKTGNTVSLTWDDIFWTTPLRWNYDRPADYLYTYARFPLAEPRIVKLNYSHTFGNKSIKALEKRSSGSEEEQQRVH